MAKNGDLTVQILREIRDELRKTREDLSARIDKTNARLDQTREELSERIEAVRTELSDRIDGLGKRVVASEMRTATAITALAGTLGDVKKLLQERREMGERVFRCEKDITKIKRHMRLS